VHVTARSIEAPIALIEQPFTTHDGGRSCLRILVFREGILKPPILNLLGRLLAHL
jgi:hypothetical protein